MDNCNLTLLTFHEACTLEVLKKYGFSTAVTDFAILTGGFVPKTAYEQYFSCSKEAFYWMIIRPVLESDEVFDKIFPHRIKLYNGVEEVEFGEYPQYAVPVKMQKKIEQAYANQRMVKTGRSFTVNSHPQNKNYYDFVPMEYNEYQFEGKKYVRIKANTCEYKTNTTKLSNNIVIKRDEIVWVEVSPVKWLIDEENRKLISKKGLISGIRFCDKNFVYNEDNFDKTDIKKFMDNYLIKDLTQSEIYTHSQFDILAEKKEVEEKQEEIKKEQKEKLMLAQKKLKEVADLLNTPQQSLKIDKIKIDNLKSLVFKNNGEQNDHGFIEFDDFFKDNSILRLIDLSDLELDNVDITNMDFSGTNIHIDPQTIYNKDMTGVNATDVDFSPFLDIFDDVILDGATITDPDVLIDLERVKGYDENTHIETSTKSIYK